MDAIVADVLDRAIAEVRSRGIAVYTFALYFDHESPALSVCVDTAANSARTVKGEAAKQRKQTKRWPAWRALRCVSRCQPAE